MVNKRLGFLRGVNMSDLKIEEKKIKPPFIIYADFESILIPEENAKQNPYKS